MKILIIDDDNFIRKFYKYKLEQEGYRVILAEDGMQGIEIAKREKPNLIMLDMMLPKKDGFEVLADLQKEKELKGIPVLIFSGLGAQGDIDKALEMGATLYLPKDRYSPDQIIKEISKILYLKNP